jgi:hypothetical protein
MSDVQKAYQKTLGKGLGTLSLLAFAWLISQAAIPQTISKNTARLLIACLSISALCYFVIAFRRRRKADALKLVSWKDDYVFIENAGIYRHKTKPGMFCSTCFQNEKVSPMIVNDHDWFCPGCKGRFKNPDNPPPHRKRISIRPMPEWWNRE